jgi:two-component sensor histidine kinase
MLINILVAFLVAILALTLASWYGRKFIRVPVDQILAVLAARRSGNARARTQLGKGGSEFSSIGHSVDELFDELDQKDSDQRLLQAQRDTFARELQHRVKNLLAIIQVIARQTLSARSTSPAVQEFERRVHALIRANAALLSDGGKDGELGAIIKDTLAPFLAENDDRVTFTGPDIRVGPKVGLALTMAIHEMATNAVKYGALSSPEGSIAVTWMLDDDKLLMDWVEAGGPAADTPAPGGFGTLMIKRVLEAETKGAVQTSFPREGFQFHLSAPRAAVQTQ